MDHNYCTYSAPIFITDELGIIFPKDSSIIQNNKTDELIRNGTTTFIKHNHKYYAVTCEHVNKVLIKKQNEWTNEQIEKHGFDPSIKSPPYNSFGFFIPHNGQFHLNYEFNKIQDSIHDIDIVITEIDPKILTEIDREAIELIDSTQINELPCIATGYPEEERHIHKNGTKLSTLAISCISCTGNANISQSNKIFLHGDLKDYNKTHNLSGISGGPIINTNNKKLLGIVTNASIITENDQGFSTNPSINIFGDIITKKLFSDWIKDIPSSRIFHDLSKTLYIPKNLRT